MQIDPGEILHGPSTAVKYNPGNGFRSMMHPINAPMKCGIGLVVLVAMAVLAADTAQAFQHFERKTWVTGISYGFGRGASKDGTGQETEFRDGGSPQVRFGRMLGRRWLLSADYQGWFVEAGNTDVRLRRSLQNIALAVTLFPGSFTGPTDGIFLRAGVGYGWAGTAGTELVTVEESLKQGEKIRFDEGGLGLMAAAGYDFWISPSFLAGLSLNFNYLDIGKDFVDTGWNVPLSFNLTWTW